jgi:histone demethylase JARID1
LKKIHTDDRQQQKLVEVSSGKNDPVHTHYSRHCLDFISGNGDDSIATTKLKTRRQLDGNILEDEVGSSQNPNGCNYLPPSVELGPKRLKILGPSFPSGNNALENCYTFQESDLASQYDQ